MQNIFKIIISFVDSFRGWVSFISFLGLKKMLKNYSKSNDDDFLSEMERKKYIRL